MFDVVGDVAINAVVCCCRCLVITYHKIGCDACVYQVPLLYCCTWYTITYITRTREVCCMSCARYKQPVKLEDSNTRTYCTLLHQQLSRMYALHPCGPLYCCTIELEHSREVRNDRTNRCPIRLGTALLTQIKTTYIATVAGLVERALHNTARNVQKAEV